MIAAAALLPAETTIWVTGDAPRSSGAAGGARIEYLGVISEDEKRRRLAAADVLCAPSLGGESFGVVLLEGLAAGCTVVASDIEGYRQALGIHGLLVAPGDHRALAVALEQAVSRPIEQRDLTRTFIESWSMSNLVDHYEDRYEASITPKRPA